MEKPIEKPKVNNSLDDFKLWAEKDPYPKHYASPTAGQQKSKYVLAIKTATSAVIGFVLDIIAAIKTIIKEIM